MNATVLIPWWGWIAIWGGLALALVGMLALFAWWLFRKGMVVLDDLDDLADITAKLDDADDTPPPQGGSCRAARAQGRACASRSARGPARSAPPGTAGAPVGEGSSDHEGGCIHPDLARRLDLITRHRGTAAP